MNPSDRWPFNPTRLSTILDRDSLAVIEAGCSARLGSALTIIDYDRNAQDFLRTDPINYRQNFRPFCRILRDEGRVIGGDHACRLCDVQQVQEIVEKGSRVRHQEYQCHMGLLDMAEVVLVHGHPVAVLLSGQFRPKNGVEQIKQLVRGIAGGKHPNIKMIDSDTTSDLLRSADELPPPPADFQARLTNEVSLVARLAEAEYDRQKALQEQRFLDSVRAFDSISEVKELGNLKEFTTDLLDKIRQFCGAQYVLFFANIQQNETVLAPLAHAGLGAELAATFPHFNWKKAGLSRGDGQLAGPIDDNAWFLRGVRGQNSEMLATAACAFPVTLGGLYRGVLVFGRFAEPVNLTREQRFLRELARIVGWFILTELEILHLQQQQKQKEGMMKLLTHQVRTAITPITTQVGGAKMLLDKPLNEVSLHLLQNYLQSAKRLALRLGSSVAETVSSHALLVERDDLTFEPYPLSVLVGNCVQAFIPEAERRGRTLVMEDSVEVLPVAESLVVGALVPAVSLAEAPEEVSEVEALAVEAPEVDSPPCVESPVGGAPQPGSVRHARTGTSLENCTRDLLVDMGRLARAHRTRAPGRWEAVRDLARPRGGEIQRTSTGAMRIVGACNRVRSGRGAARGSRGRGGGGSVAPRSRRRPGRRRRRRLPRRTCPERPLARSPAPRRTSGCTTARARRSRGRAGGPRARRRGRRSRGRRRSRRRRSGR